jgi:hypothetical protein
MRAALHGARRAVTDGTHGGATGSSCNGFGPPAMSDERYLVLLLWTICVLTFACGIAAITQHPEWFGT